MRDLENWPDEICEDSEAERAKAKVQAEHRMGGDGLNGSLMNLGLD